jgi:DNA-binding MarR family transcriptional regulator
MGFLVTSDPQACADIEQVRRFDRVCERRLVERQDRALANELPWAEMRVIHELGQVADGRTASWLNGRLDLDPAYLCRILKKLCAAQWAASAVPHGDRRQREYALTEPGRALYRKLDEFHRHDATMTLEFLPPGLRRKFVRGLATVEFVLSKPGIDHYLERCLGARKRARYLGPRARSRAASAPNRPSGRT